MIKVDGLTKYYGRRLAVDNISFEIGKGEIVGFLGPNGAGKTTTMRMIAGCLVPTSGDVWVAGHNMVADSLEGRRLVGYLPETVPLYPDMTIRSYLDFMGNLRGLGKKTTRVRIGEVIEECHLTEYVDVMIGKLSKGFRQRVGLAQAIIHDPVVLILDEPTIGIDPIEAADTRALIRDFGQNHTVLLSTHVLSEVGSICERVLIIHRGRIVVQDRIDKLSTILAGDLRIRVHVQGPPEEVTDRLRQMSSMYEVTYEAPYHIIVCPQNKEPRTTITETMVEEGWTLLSMDSSHMSLEEVFLHFTASDKGLE